MKKHLEILQKCPLFHEIEEENLLATLGCLGAKIKSFDKKDTIFAKGDAARQIGIVLSGSAQIFQVDYYGNRSILSDVRPSEVFAEAFACAGVPSLPVTVIANEPCEVMLMECDRILHICPNNCSAHQQMILNLVKDLASKTIMFQQRIEITSKRSTREKLMTYLMFYAKKANNNSFDIPFNRQELADYLEVDRSGLSTEIGKLRKEGLIQCDRNHFVLLK